MQPRLKSLELHGYKTFANRTAFEFPGMVTAVVGPNGSGKSNIADALRWVLGEQSYSILRGKKTEDMIFAGSEQRPRSGMASATITFDNSDGWLPVDYSEVAITRRAYRDGQNDYLLNGQRVRLKEISELLAQCGLSERTYTVIGQGLVDAALSLRPEERRQLFEEAAGIGLYRSRKEEALHRLEATQRNLDRVEDILVEIQPRLQSLEKQARRVQEYERTKADLQLLLRDWYGYHWFETQRELNHVTEIMKTQENRLEQARLRQLQSGQDMAALRSQVQERRARLTDLYAQSAKNRDQIQRVSRDLAILDERQKALLESKRSLESDLVRAEEEGKAYVDSLGIAEKERDQLTGELESSNLQAQTVRQELAQRRKERNGIEKAIQENRQALVAVETRLAQVHARQQELSQRIDGLRKNTQSIASAIEVSQQELKKAQDKLVEAEKANQLAEINQQTIREELKVVQKKIAETENERKDLLEKRLKVDSEAARLRIQIDGLEQAEESLSGLSDGARYLLQAIKQGRIKGQFNSLSGAMDVPLEYETAVAAALGEYLDLILLEGDNDPESVFGFLEKDAKGRVALLPVAWAEVDEPLHAPDDVDCLGVVSELIQVEERLKRISQVLLGNVLIVRNRAAARRILKMTPPQTRAVTLQGELFNANGLVLAGVPGRSGVIGRKRQKRELAVKMALLNTQIHEYNQAIDQFNAALSDLRSKEADKTNEARQIAEQSEKARKAYSNCQLAVEQVKRQHQWQVNQQNDLDKQTKQSEIEEKQTSTEITNMQTRISQYRRQSQQLSGDLAKIPLDEIQNQVVHWDTTCAVAQRALQDAEKRVTERRQILIANQKRCAGLHTRLDETDQSLERLVENKQNLQLQENQVSEQNRQLQGMIDPLVGELAEKEKAFDELQALDTTAQQALTVAERYSTQAQLDHSRQQEALDALRRRIEDDMGLVALAYEGNVTGPTPLPLDGLVGQLPAVTELSPNIDEDIARQRAQLRRMGAVNMEAQKEYDSVLERYQFMTSQVADLHKADASLREVIGELDGLMKRDFSKTFNAVAVEFHQLFTRLFGGGSARLVLFDEENPQDSGIDIEARLPGRREQGLSLLSGGERSLTATALVFALLKVSPTPFCVMDEVDAMLDEANVGRFVGLLKELSQETQFVVITHNRNTVQAADVIYGVTMGRDSISQLISLKLDEIDQEMVN